MSCKYRVKVSNETTNNLAAGTGISMDDTKNVIQAEMEKAKQHTHIAPGAAIALLHGTDFHFSQFDDIDDTHEYAIGFPGTDMTNVGIGTEHVSGESAFYYNKSQGFGRLASDSGKIIQFKVDPETGVISDPIIMGKLEAHESTDMCDLAAYDVIEEDTAGLAFDKDDIATLTRAQIALNSISSVTKKGRKPYEQAKRRLAGDLRHEFGSIAAARREKQNYMYMDGDMLRTVLGPGNLTPVLSVADITEQDKKPAVK